MLFSVIIATYNRAEFLRRSIQSVQRQSFSDFELIIVDDGSTDGTRATLQTCSGRLIVVGQSNLGPGAARNRGARIAQGDYLAFLDDDDLWFPWTLESYARILADNRRPAFLAGKPFQFQNECELELIQPTQVKRTWFQDYLASGTAWRWWGASSMVLRKDAFEAAGGFAALPINGEDADLALRLGVAPGFVQALDPITFAYRRNPGSAMTQLPRTTAGALHKIRSEHRGVYPGGTNRALERRRILTRHVRPVSLECLKQGFRKEAWELYRRTFRWHLRLGRGKFIAGFVVKALLTR